MAYLFASESVSEGHPDKVAFLHLAHIGAKLEKLEKEQAEYIGVPQAGPYKPEHYRY